MSFDLEKKLVKLTFKSREQLLEFEGINAISFILEDNAGNRKEFTAGVNIKTPEIKKTELVGNWKPPADDGKFVKAFIKKISVLGEVTIKFNTHMRVKNPNITLSHINSTIVDCYIVPTGNWHLTKKHFKMEHLNFTWNVTFYEENFMKLKLNFTDPSYISPGLPYDRFVFHIKEKYHFFVSSEYLKDLHDNYTTLD